MTCPHCGLHMDVSLKGKPTSMIVFVCARCKVPLMRYGEEVFELDREEFSFLRKKLSRIVDALIEKIDDSVAIPGPFPDLNQEVENLSEVSNNAEPILEELLSSESTSVSGVITESDISDILIDLETCEDVSDFIARI